MLCVGSLKHVRTNSFGGFTKQFSFRRKLLLIFTALFLYEVGVFIYDVTSGSSWLSSNRKYGVTRHSHASRARGAMLAKDKIRIKTWLTKWAGVGVSPSKLIYYSEKHQKARESSVLMCSGIIILKP